MSSDCVFIVGCGRSGTTLLYEILGLHSDVTWISTWSDRTNRPELAVMNGLFRAGRSGEVSRRGTPRPAEGYRSWDRVLPDDHDATSILSLGDVDHAATARAQAMASSYRRWGRAPIFLNKNTRNTRRLNWLSHAFPDATFVHVVRHPLDVVSSLLSVDWWPELRLWTEAAQTPGTQDRATQVEWAAGLWSAEVGCVLAAERTSLPGQFITVRYEELVENAPELVAGLLRELSLEQTRGVTAGLERLRLRKSVGAHRTRLTSEEADIAWSRLSDDTRALGYV